MPQIFHRSANTIARVSIFGAIFILAAIIWAAYEINGSSYVTQAYVPKEQPVQFSHKHHVGDDGIDCRYCHTSVEQSSFAGIPPTKTCMNCHSQLFANSPYLAIVRDSWRNDKPIIWKRVHDLPDYVYFNHSIHVKKGVGCSTCHGRVDLMPLVYQVASLQMNWCLECHRHPEKFVRPRDQIYNMAWEPPPDQIQQGRRLVEQYKILDQYALTRCSICHR
jgi:formamidopyrimidine-DNA glycosylase